MGGGKDLLSRSPLTAPCWKMAFLLLLLVSSTWLLGLLAVNSNTLSFHYLFAAFSCLQVGASIHPLGPLCDLCPGAASARRRWGEASSVRRGWGEASSARRGLGGSLLSTYTCRGGSLCSPLVPALPPGPESVRVLPWIGQDKACPPPTAHTVGLNPVGVLRTHG